MTISTFVACALTLIGSGDGQAPGEEQERGPVRIEVPMPDGKVGYVTGRDAILYCVVKKDDKGLGRLLKEGHDLKTPYDKEGHWTYLHMAASQGSPEAVKALIAAGADVNASFEGGPTPARVARDRGRKAIVTLLRKHGAK